MKIAQTLSLLLKFKLTEFKLTVLFCKQKVVLLVGMQCYGKWHWWTSFVIILLKMPTFVHVCTWGRYHWTNVPFSWWCLCQFLVSAWPWHRLPISYGCLLSFDVDHCWLSLAVLLQIWLLDWCHLLKWHALCSKGFGNMYLWLWLDLMYWLGCDGSGELKHKLGKTHRGLPLDEWLEIVSHFSDWRLTLLQLCKVCIASLVVDAGPI